MKDSTKKAATKEDLARSGEGIANSETRMDDNMLMNEASKNSVELIQNDYGNKNKAIRDKYETIAKECNRVQEQQLKNHQAIQQVKEEYKKAYDRIVKKYKDDKTKIFRNLDDYKKANPMKNQGE